MQHVVVLKNAESGRQDLEILAKVLEDVGAGLAYDGDGIIRITWDDQVVRKKRSRGAGNKHKCEKIHITDVIKALPEFQSRKNEARDQFTKEMFGISESTFQRRLRFFRKKYGGLEQAVAAGKKFFTDREEKD